MIKSNNKDYFLAGDIGGTKTNLGLFMAGKRRPVLKTMETYDSSDAPGLEAIVEQFLSVHRCSISSACFGIAGPVQDGRCRTTNLPWIADERDLKKRFRWKKARLINDLTATALAIPFLNSNEIFSLNSAKARKGETIALIAPGTGLGEALLVSVNDRYVPVSSEGGHADFAPNNRAQADLWKYLRDIYGHVSLERVLTGSGLFSIYSWLKDSKKYKEPSWLSEEIRETDPARVITSAALNRSQPLCRAALDLFVSVLGSAAGNLALTGMTTGGVYLGGGIPPKILPGLKQDTFMKSFIDKGRFRDFMEKIPVKVILNDRAALLGAALCASRFEP